MITVTEGHTIQNTIIYLDQNGNPMKVTPTPDTAPTWMNSPNPTGIDEIIVSADGSECDLKALMPGADTLNLSVTVGGHTFSASVSVTIEAAPQVLTSVVIASNVV